MKNSSHHKHWFPNACVRCSPNAALMPSDSKRQALQGVINLSHYKYFMAASVKQITEQPEPAKYWHDSPTAALP